MCESAASWPSCYFCSVKKGAISFSIKDPLTFFSSFLFDCIILRRPFNFVNLQPRGRPVSSQKKLRPPKKCVKLKLLTVGFCAVKLGQ